MRIQSRFLFFNVLYLCVMSYQSIEVTDKPILSSYDNENLIIPRIFHEKRIVCYLGSWSLGLQGINVEFDIDPNLCTHIIYAFASFNENGIMIDENFGKRIRLFHLVLNYRMFRICLIPHNIYKYCFVNFR